jgi:Tol biopolymer transport system component
MWNIWSRRADAAGEEERLSTSSDVQVPLAMSPDGRWIVYVEGAGPATGNLFRKPADPSGPVQPLFSGRTWGYAAGFSPDGRWLAYESTDTGRTEIYARPFPEGDQRVQISTGGGEMPVWSRSGEVFYHSGGSVYAVAVTPRAGSLEVSKPTRLFQTAAEAQLVPVFDVTPDGQRFFMLRARGRPHVSLIFNWPRDLAQLAAADGAGGEAR